jgi:hypothetical protein
LDTTHRSFPIFACRLPATASSGFVVFRSLSAVQNTLIGDAEFVVILRRRFSSN